MSQINFGLLQNAQNGFQNALANGFQAGQAAGSFMEGRREGQERNALSAYAADPTRDGLEALAQHRPDLAMSERGRFDQQDAAQAQQQSAQSDTVRRLLRQAGSSPEGWQQAMGAARQMGIDTARFPQQFDPQWAQTQMLILDALSDPATATAVVNDVRAMGLDPETPEGMDAVRELTLYKYGKQVTDENGAPAMSLPTITLPGQGGQPAPDRAPQWGSGQTFTFDQFRANVAGMGLGPALANMERSGIAVQITDDAQYDSLPSGATFRAPDGSMRRKP